MLDDLRFCAFAMLAATGLTMQVGRCHAEPPSADEPSANEACDESNEQIDEKSISTPEFHPYPLFSTEEFPKNFTALENRGGVRETKRNHWIQFQRPKVRPPEWEFTVPSNSDDYRAPLWAAIVPCQRPMVHGRWVWLPDPSEIRSSGIFAPDAVVSTRDIGPGQPEDDKPTRGFCLHCDCPLCCHSDEECLTPPTVPGPSATQRCPSGERLTERDMAEIAELMARRPSVVDGSLLEREDTDCPGHGPASCGDCGRQSAMARLRRIEEDVARMNPDVWGAEPPALQQQVTSEQRVADSIRVLRETSFDLDVAAQRLEDQQLYYRADQLREFASQLRQEARSALGGWSLKRLQPQMPEAPVGAERDLGLELEQLRDELHRVREALRGSGETLRR